MKSLCSVFLMLLGSLASQGQTTAEVLTKMFKAIDETKEFSFQLTNTERLKNKTLTGNQFVIINKNTESVYIRFIHPNKGGQVTFQKGKNNDKITYKTPGTGVSVSLDPLGDLVRKNNHHTIYEIGYTYFQELVKHSYKTNPKSFGPVEKIKHNGEEVYKIVAKNQDYAIIEYTVADEKTVVDIAKKLMVDDYKLLELNAEIKNFNDKLKPGQKLKVPTHYAKEMILYISPNNFLPCYIEVQDEKGLYEKYEYKDFKVKTA
ncbi:MAG: DUF1571 domain-containing protein [Flavobacteriales bacterium]